MKGAVILSSLQIFSVHSCGRFMRVCEEEESCERVGFPHCRFSIGGGGFFFPLYAGL